MVPSTVVLLLKIVETKLTDSTELKLCRKLNCKTRNEIITKISLRITNKLINRSESVTECTVKCKENHLKHDCDIIYRLLTNYTTNHYL